jgi:TRAP-type C4-dicarboxylate transport system permease small subunit
MAKNKAKTFKMNVGSAYRTLMHYSSIVAATMYACIAIVISTDVLLRNLTHGLNLPWALEASEYLLGAATFIAAPWGLFVNAHVRVDVVLHIVNQHTGQLLELIGSLIAGIVSLSLFFFSVEATVASAEHGNMVIKTLIFPEWWLYIPVMFCFLLLSVEFARRTTLAANGTIETAQEEAY